MQTSAHVLMNGTTELASVQNSLEIVEVFVRVNLMSSSTSDIFLNFVLIRDKGRKYILTKVLSLGMIAA